jgi:hypothetical protein
MEKFIVKMRKRTIKKSDNRKIKKLQWKLNSIIQDPDSGHRQYISSVDTIHRRYVIQNYMNKELLENQWVLEINGRDIIYYASLELAKKMAQLDLEHHIYNLFFE